MKRKSTNISIDGMFVVLAGLTEQEARRLRNDVAKTLSNGCIKLVKHKENFAISCEDALKKRKQKVRDDALKKVILQCEKHTDLDELFVRQVRAIAKLHLSVDRSLD